MSQQLEKAGYYEAVLISLLKELSPYPDCIKQVVSIYDALKKFNALPEDLK